MALLLAAALVVGQVASDAPGYTRDDSYAAIEQAANDTGVSAARLLRVARCESLDMNPYALGDFRRGRPTSYGLVQLHEGGLLGEFYARFEPVGDPFNPYQAARFLAEKINEGRATAWTCR